LILSWRGGKHTFSRQCRCYKKISEVCIFV